MGTALGCSLGLIPLQFDTTLAMAFYPAGYPPSDDSRVDLPYVAVPLLQGGLSRIAVHGFAITGDGCQAVFRCLTTVYTPMRVYFVIKNPATEMVGPVRREPDGNRTRNENRVKA